MKSLCTAFLMYSKIPVPRVEWCEKNRRWALGFFPLVGAVAGGVLLLWRYLCSTFEVGQVLFAAVAVAIPIAVTGGIHMDGFCDVTDAKCSYGDREKKLDIMKDPHIGSFAVIYACLYFLLQFGAFTQVKTFRETVIIAVGYVLSRALSGLSAVTFRSAKSSGSLYTFTTAADRKVTVGMEIFFIVLANGTMMSMSVPVGAWGVFGAVAALMFYKLSAYKNFGGITGDVCGWFVQICELWVLLGAVAGERLLKVM